MIGKIRNKLLAVPPIIIDIGFQDTITDANRDKLLLNL
jgi:hypothetical protein